ncbi:MAG: hypothetical protein JSS14_15285 [Proteobacteria bacterium]|nr:hypothetical protein [Pseudomonadota bacterium]
MKKILIPMMGIWACTTAMSQSGLGREAESVAYCLAATERFIESDRATIAMSGAASSVRDAAGDSLVLNERSLRALRARSETVPQNDRSAMAVAARNANADADEFLKHFEVCWNYCAGEDLRANSWPACISTCRKADPLISRLDQCRLSD